MLKQAAYSYSFHIRSVIDPYKEVNGPPYPFILLPSDKTTLIFHLAWRLKFWNITVNIGRWIVEAGKDTHWLESCRYANKICNQGETENMVSFSWSSRMTIKMRNNQVQKRSHFLANEIAVELLQLVSKWEIFGCGA